MQPTQILTDRYCLTPANIDLLRSTGGRLKDVYRVQTGQQTYILKRYLAHFRSLPDVTAQHEAQRYLRRHGFPVPAVIPDRDGSLACQEGLDCWVLYEQAPGRHYAEGAVTPRSAAAVGDMLARMTQQLERWPSTWVSPEPLQVDPADETLALFETLLKHAEQGTTPSDRLCEAVLRYRIGAVQRLAHYAPRLLAMERQWVHGDVNAGNFLFGQDDCISGIIDFDNMRRAPRGFDFMYGLTGCFVDQPPLRDEYARAYFRHIRPSVAELELYAPLWAYREVCDIWPVKVRYLQPEAYDGNWQIDPPTDRWERQIAEVTEWLLQIAQ
jgi:Ser/Thr protein kinase RdoA (MazF antagonist)